MGFSIYSIASENRFWRILAREILQGFPVGHSDIPLSRWIILVPNRRSARTLQTVLLAESNSEALLMPQIKPIGDIDEELVADSLPQDGVDDAISPSNQVHAILGLLLDWAKRTPESELAEDILESGGQAFALAQSLQQLVNQLETEDTDISAIKAAYDHDIAGHRTAILDLLGVVMAELPRRLEQEQLIGPAARRNQMIRLEAKRIAARRLKGPVIAAGSTGTNPATRDLLKAIAEDPMGAVVLPGLDFETDWETLTPEHPQFALQSLLSAWNIRRQDVQRLGDPRGLRSWLMSEALRPAAVVHTWRERLLGKADDVQKALTQVDLVECKDRNEEAEVIALAFLYHIKHHQGQASLITPDRDLATRVKAALAHWNVTIDDSAGSSLIHQGRAALLHLLLRAVDADFSAQTLFALLHHSSCTLGIDRIRTLELAGYRGLPEAKGLHTLASRLIARRKTNDPHAHPLIKNMADEDWDQSIALALELHALLSPLADQMPRSLAEHITRLLTVLDAMATEETTDDFAKVMAALAEGSHWHPVMSLRKAQHSILQALVSETLRPPQSDSRLAIYGLPEARLIDVEFAVLGGLVEGAWPASPDPGPWLNRSMRTTLNMQQPEREIGTTAHDFAQAFGHPRVMVTWCKRLGGAPAIASRWILRLQAVLQTAGLDPKDHLAAFYPKLARSLDAEHRFAPLQRPHPSPPVESRPTRFSVTRVEKLVRDSYAIFAEMILKLKPLDDVGDELDASLRGTLVHAALKEWAEDLSQVPPGERLALLLAKGQSVFAPYMDMPEVSKFWWPRFERMAVDFIALDKHLRRDVIGTRVELSAEMTVDIQGTEHVLTARADRIDILQNGDLHIIDYKTGGHSSMKQVASGFAPQLTLEAALAQAGAFKSVEAADVHDVSYLTVGGGKSVEQISLAKDHDVATEAAKALQGFIALMQAYRNPDTRYIPRHNPEYGGEHAEYDHLSRYQEWSAEAPEP